MDQEEIESELFKILQEEINKEVLRLAKIAALEARRYIKIERVHHRNVDAAWIEEHVSGDYETFDDIWFFEKEEDAVLFVLKWK